MSYAVGTARKMALTSWETIWYVVQNIFLGAGYLAKVPAKKAMQDFGLVEMTGAEQFWYVVLCICFGAGYFGKIPTAKALTELPQYRSGRQAALTTLTTPEPPAPTAPLQLRPAEAQPAIRSEAPSDASEESPAVAEG